MRALLLLMLVVLTLHNEATPFTTALKKLPFERIVDERNSNPLVEPPLVLSSASHISRLAESPNLSREKCCQIPSVLYFENVLLVAMVQFS